MSLQSLNGLDINWYLRSSLTVDNDVLVEGDLNTTGFIYDGGIPLDIQDDNNVWTGHNSFTNFQPTFLAPVADEDMTTYDYMSTAFTGLGAGLLPTNNAWTAQNSFIALPTITNNAVALTNEAVNKVTADAYIATYTGNLGTANIWTGTNTFSNVMNVPTPVLPNAFGNKKYIDDEIIAFNAGGGNIEYVESLIQFGAGPLTVNLDPAIYSNMIVCMVGAGGLGAPAGTVVTGATVKSFGGSGGYACFRIPAFIGNHTYSIQEPVPASGDYLSVYEVQDSTNLVLVGAGLSGSVGASGAGGSGGVAPSISGTQFILGSVEPLQNPITDDTITRSYNIGCLNGYGQGGSFRWDTGTTVAPSGFYALFIKFRK